MVILYKRSVYISHKNKSKKKRQNKNSSYKTIQETDSDHLISHYFQEKTNKQTTQFLRIRYKRDMDLQPSVTSQVTRSSTLQVLSSSNPQQFPQGEMLFVEWAQCTGFPCHLMDRPSPGAQTLALVAQRLLRTQQRDLQTAVMVYMCFMNE